MKKIAVFPAGIFLCLFCYAQAPVKWNFDSRKISDKVYEIHISASIDPSWHIYSQGTPDGGPVPTKISFTKNPVIELNGNAKEIGKLEQKHEEVFDIDVKYFEGKVEFVQTIKLKAKIKTKLNGQVEFMVCTDRQCLPPTTIPFSVAIQ